MFSTDGRTAAARRFRDLCRCFSEALPTPAVSETQRQLVRRAASLSVLAEGLEDRLADGEPVDPAAMVKLTGSLRRVLASLGLSARNPKPEPGESLEQYCARIGPLPELALSDHTPTPTPSRRRKRSRDLDDEE